MRYILDTHVLIWALENSFKLPQEIKDTIIDERNEIYVSAVNIWEISIKHKKNPYQLPCSGNEIVHYCQRAGYRFLAVSIEDVMAYDTADFKNHKDPFDTMLIAQCQNAKMKIITHDKIIKDICPEVAVFF